MIFHIFHISGWSQVSSSSAAGGPGAASTPNLPTSTPKHQAIYVTSSIRPSVSKITSETSLTSSSTSQSHLRSQINGSSSQLSKAEEKIQGRGMCRSSATYGIQQLLQEQVCDSIFYYFLMEGFIKQFVFRYLDFQGRKREPGQTDRTWGQSGRSQSDGLVRRATERRSCGTQPQNSTRYAEHVIEVD